MKQSAPGNIIIICDSCKGPLFISPLQESIISKCTNIICLECKHSHTDLEPLKNYAKQTRSYGHL